MLHRLVGRRGSIEHVGVCIENEKLAQRVVHLEEQLRLERLHRYAPRSEKLTERIFNEAEQAAAEGEETDDVEAAPIADTGLPDAEKPEPKKRGRKPLPEDLPRERVEHDLSRRPKGLPVLPEPDAPDGRDRQLVQIELRSRGGYYWYGQHTEQYV